MSELQPDIETTADLSTRHSFQSVTRVLAPLTANELLLALIASTLLGFFVRFVFVSAVDFPVNDGGMFYSMTRDIQANDYRLPSHTSYNAAGIPFAYPPLMFYVAAVLDDLTGMSLLTIFRVLPLIGSTLTIPAFFLISRNLLQSRLAIQMSTLAFALIPRVFDWQISGGGLTRAYGLLFAMLAIHQSTRLLMLKKRNAWPPIALFGALSLLCHPEMGLFFVYSYAVLFIASRPGRPEFVSSAYATVLAGMLSAPWWGWVIAEHGADTLLHVGGSNLVALPLALRIMDPAALDEPFFPIHMTLGFIGAVACIGMRRPFLPVWLLLIFLLDPRKAPTYASIPFATLEGVAISCVLLPSLRAMNAPAPRLSRAFLGGLALFWIGSSLASPVSRSSPLAAVSQDGQAIYEWVQSDTAPLARFVIVTDRPWAVDPFGEWFPAVTGRRSLATVQGQEWFGGSQFRESAEIHEDLQDCAEFGADCLDSWAAALGEKFEYLVVAQPDVLTLAVTDSEVCCRALVVSLDSSASYRLVYSGPGGFVYQISPNGRYYRAASPSTPR